MKLKIDKAFGYFFSAEIPAHKEENAAGDTCCLPCRVVFCSAKPVSFTKPIVFHDGQGHR